MQFFGCMFNLLLFDIFLHHDVRMFFNNCCHVLPFMFLEIFRRVKCRKSLTVQPFRISRYISKYPTVSNLEATSTFANQLAEDKDMFMIKLFAETKSLPKKLFEVQTREDMQPGHLGCSNPARNLKSINKNFFSLSIFYKWTLKNSYYGGIFSFLMGVKSNGYSLKTIIIGDFSLLS